ncbi:MAG: hypothetical protein PHI25_11910 [Zoogloea sp.]|nr:hypothetical protein [Zoogloea sp.]
MEETALHTTLSQVVRMSKGEMHAFHDANQCPDDDRLHRYYFLLRQKHRKSGRKTPVLNTLCAFGPYRSPYAASFIQISARALGLLEPDGVA